MSSASQIYVQLQKLQNQANETEMKYNAQEANTARVWQKMMSDTAHQREVVDLKSAGLNPVLASNNGAQSYTTSSASANIESASNAVANAYGSFESAQATRAAAAQSAAATRYAASMNYAAAVYAADRQYDSQRDNRNTLWGNIDKRSDQVISALTDAAKKTKDNALKNFADRIKDLNIKKMFSSPVKTSFNSTQAYNALSFSGKFEIKKALVNAGYVPTKNAIKAVAYAHATGKDVNWERWLIKNRS